MPYPKKYKEYASVLSPFKWYFLLIAGIGILLSVFSILLSVKFQINLIFLHGVGFLFVLWGWGLFLIQNWYGEKSKFSKKFPKLILVIAEWFSSILLDVWFMIGTIGSAIFILKIFFRATG
nr:hypothetical protein [uncultured Desulfobacter sp.]